MKCNDCGHKLKIGEWPFCGDRKNAHEKPAKSKGFEPYYDENISDNPVWISTPGDRKKYLKPHWEQDYVVHLQERR